MGKSFVSELENILGVKIGESFTLDGCDRVFHLDKQLRLWEHDLERDRISSTVALRKILNGEYGIIKLPFKPELDEKYWYVTSDGEADENVYTGSTLDKYCAISGNRFRTEDDATNNTPRIMKEVFGNELP